MAKRLVERARIVDQVRRFFAARGFLEVETPLAVPSPGLDVHLDAFVLDGGGRYLVTSPEYQMKRLLAAGYARIFQLARCFRRGELGSHHNPEFTMLEWYRTHAGLADVMADTEQLVTKVTRGAVTCDGRSIDTRPPYVRLTVCEAFERYAGLGAADVLRLAADSEERYFRLLVDAVEPALARLERAVFLTHFPASQASLARTVPGQPELAERFELYVGGVELCNGFGELVDAVEQRARLERDQEARRRRGLPVYPIDERFLDALTQGIPPTGGNALGLDRLVALACGAADIRDVMAFADDEL